MLHLTQPPKNHRLHAAFTRDRARGEGPCHLAVHPGKMHGTPLSGPKQASSPSLQPPSLPQGPRRSHRLRHHLASSTPHHGASPPPRYSCCPPRPPPAVPCTPASLRPARSRHCSFFQGIL